MSLLDKGLLPVEGLASLADREGRRPIPIYQAHRWFARRFSSAFRAILTASKLRPGDDFWAAFYSGVDCTGATVLDPFVGGGTSVVEAARLGATTVGVDIDPVACAITRFELRAADVTNLEPALGLLQKKVGTRMAGYYQTTGPAGDLRQIVHAFWVQVVRCRRCRMVIEAHPCYQLAYEAEGEHQWVFCPICHQIRRLNRDVASFKCKGCGTRSTIAAGPVQHGRITCPSCEAEEDLIDLAERTNSVPKWRLFALETIPQGSPDCRVPMAGRAFQTATDADRLRMTAARRALARRKDAVDKWKWIPERRIPTEHRADNRLIKYGYQHYRDLFNPRQLLHLSLLAEAIAGLQGTTREAMSFAFSDHLTTNCMLTQYAFGWRRLAPLFSIRAYRHICRPVEINPWLNGTGRGTFPNTVRQMQSVVAYAKAPYVAHLDGGFVVPEATGRTPCQASTILHEDSRVLAGVPDRSVDLILTDPPYCDNIAYSELSDFFLPWLQQFGIVPSDDSPCRLPANLAAQSRGNLAVKAFQKGLAACFTQMGRVLKSNGRVVFSYQHRTPEAWNALALAISAGGMVPIQTFPLLGNSSAGLHQHEGTVLWDAVLVCRKGPKPVRERRLFLSASQIAAARRHASAWENRLDKCQHTAFRDVDHENLLRATLVAASLGMFGRPCRDGRPLLDALTSPP